MVTRGGERLLEKMFLNPANAEEINQRTRIFGTLKNMMLHSPETRKSATWWNMKYLAG